MKKTILILLTLTLFSITANAQLGKGREKIRAYKVAYLTERLNLTSKEAEKFWPLYNNYDKKRKELFLLEKKEVKNKIKESDGIDNLSNDEAKNIIKKIYNLQEAQHENRIAFQENLFKFLSPKKILLLEISEHEFNKKLMSRLREKRGFRK
ncbi:hypothetical protein C7447_10926 [Tenacibaculum adriaticum]|uniref:LTXXQ motif family protein n=1 Tax=Tenacibaculum adriaticum TaxID=413713 RepID=A0A5S5DN23_9FLAO|nr:hypothetical protein [Tenacibaculum adriaticum]TYP96089.1 hypothetical protein C7447_10926 [Tenacibaculum adriaticum]